MPLAGGWRADREPFPTPVLAAEWLGWARHCLACRKEGVRWVEAWPEPRWASLLVDLRRVARAERAERAGRAEEVEGVALRSAVWVRLHWLPRGVECQKTCLASRSWS